MRENTFKRPSVRKVLDLVGVVAPERIYNYDSFLLSGLSSGEFAYSGETYEDAVRMREDLEEGKVLVYSRRFRIPKEKSDRNIKYLEKIVKIDSVESMQDISGKKNAFPKITRGFMEKYVVTPYMLRVAGLKNSKLDVENPPWGVYFVGDDKRSRVFTFLGDLVAREMFEMYKKGEFKMKVVDKVPYAKSLSLEVDSRTEEGLKYPITLFNLPMHRRNDPRRFSDWIDLGFSSEDRDSHFKGIAHEARRHPAYFFSSSVGLAFYGAGEFIKGKKDLPNVQMNPFGVLRVGQIKFVDDLRLNSLIIDKDEKGKSVLRVLNKSEINEQLGARTQLYGYDKL